jgi:hypothetical protein
MIRECKGAWGSKLLPARKPNQEHITNINNFSWRRCVNYCALNAVTPAFEYPMARCNNSIDNFGDSHGPLFFISVDGKSGFHQVFVSKCSQEKLAFFAPDLNKYCYNIMPFGPKRVPAVFTAMMRKLQDLWDSLFHQRHPQSVPHVKCKIFVDDTLMDQTYSWQPPLTHIPDYKYLPQPIATLLNDRTLLAPTITPLLHPDFPGTKSTQLPYFSLPFTDAFGIHHARNGTSEEVLHLYSIPPSVCNHLSSTTTRSCLLDQLHTSCPFALAFKVAEIIYENHSLTSIQYHAPPINLDQNYTQLRR